MLLITLSLPEGDQLNSDELAIVKTETRRALREFGKPKTGTLRHILANIVRDELTDLGYDFHHRKAVATAIAISKAIGGKAE